MHIIWDIAIYDCLMVMLRCCNLTKYGWASRSFFWDKDNGLQSIGSFQWQMHRQLKLFFPQGWTLPEWRISDESWKTCVSLWRLTEVRLEKTVDEAVIIASDPPRGWGCGESCVCVWRRGCICRSSGGSWNWGWGSHKHHRRLSKQHKIFQWSNSTSLALQAL